MVGKQQQLFMFSPLAPGSPFFLPHGARIYNRLIEFLRSEYRQRGNVTHICTTDSYIHMHTNTHTHTHTQSHMYADTHAQLHSACTHTSACTPHPTSRTPSLSVISSKSYLPADQMRFFKFSSQVTRRSSHRRCSIKNSGRLRAIGKTIKTICLLWRHAGTITIRLRMLLLLHTPVIKNNTKVRGQMWARESVGLCAKIV